MSLLHLESLEAEVQTHSRRVAEAFLDTDLLQVRVCVGASPSASGCARCRSLASFRTNKLSPRNFSCARIPVEFRDPGKPDKPYPDVGR